MNYSRSSKSIEENVILREYNLSPEVSSAILSSDNESFSDHEFQPILYEELIEDLCPQLTKALTDNRYADCVRFPVERNASSEEIFKNIDDFLDSSSEPSSAFVSVYDLNYDDAAKMVLAVKKSESRKSSSANYPPDYSLIIPLNDKREIGIAKDKISELNSMRSRINVSAEEKVSLFEKIPESKYLVEPFFKFNLPTNLELLRDDDTLSYLEKYSWICDSRLAFYQKEYTKYRDHRETSLPLSKLFLLINDILANTLTERQFATLCKILELKENSTIQFKHIFHICAVAERMFFTMNLSQDSGTAFEINKSFQEKIDFTNIIQKLQNYSVKQSLENLLAVL